MFLLLKDPWKRIYYHISEARQVNAGETGEYLLSDREENTMPLSRSRNSNAPLGRRGTSR